MENFNRKQHWEKIYKTRELKDVSWYQSRPETSLEFISLFKIPIDAGIIDIGGGDSLFADYLLSLGYKDITVLDISGEALEKAKRRIGPKSAEISWIIEDAAKFVPNKKYDFWHDRAAFHFLTDEQEISHYMQSICSGLKQGGIAVIGTFSEQGPLKCSGIEIKQYSEDSLSELMKPCFEKIKCLYSNHITPSGTIQNFIFCAFKKL